LTQVDGSREQVNQLQSELHRLAAEAENRLSDVQTLMHERDSLSQQLKTVKDEVELLLPFYSHYSELTFY